MIEKNSLLGDLYTDSGGFDAERVDGLLKPLLTIQRGMHAMSSGNILTGDEKVFAYVVLRSPADRKLPDGQITTGDARRVSSPSAKNISLKASGKSILQLRASRPKRGALAIVTNVGRDAVDAAVSQDERL